MNKSWESLPWRFNWNTTEPVTTMKTKITELYGHQTQTIQVQRNIDILKKITFIYNSYLVKTSRVESTYTTSIINYICVLLIHIKKMYVLTQYYPIYMNWIYIFYLGSMMFNKNTGKGMIKEVDIYLPSIHSKIDSQLY